jgi:hypothetical protein
VQQSDPLTVCQGRADSVLDLRVDPLCSGRSASRLVPFSRALALPALIRHEKEQNLPPPPSFSRNDSPAVFVSATPNLLKVSR